MVLAGASSVARRRPGADGRREAGRRRAPSAGFTGQEGRRERDRPSDTSTALHWAVQANSLEIVNLLIDAGANVNAATRYKITPLSLASTNGNAAIIERLLKAGVDPNGTSEEGQTALMTAALNGNADAIKMLLAHGAKVNAVEPYKGQTALMWAAGEGNADAAALLIEFGADVKAKSKAGFTPLLFAVLNNQINAVKVLLDHGANIEDRAPDGSTTLNMAIINAYYDMASVLLDHGANPNVQDLNGTPLHSAGVDAQARVPPGKRRLRPRIRSPFRVPTDRALRRLNWPRNCWRRAPIRTRASPGRKCR